MYLRRENFKSHFASNLFSSRMSDVPRSSRKKPRTNKGTPPKAPKGTSKLGGQSTTNEVSLHPQFVSASKNWSKSQAKKVSKVLLETEAMDEKTKLPHVFFL